MGACGSRDRAPIVDGAHDEENFSFAAECAIRLHKIEFRAYQAAIKRFGYRMDLNEEHFKSISDEIALDYEKMLAEKTKGQGLAYLDPKFSFKDGKHNVENLILLGWLLCRHWDDATQATELWHIINPTLRETVPRKEIVAVIKKLCYIAIDLNVTMLNSLKDSPEKKSALKYHAKIKANRDAFLK